MIGVSPQMVDALFWRVVAITVAALLILLIWKLPGTPASNGFGSRREKNG